MYMERDEQAVVRGGEGEASKWEMTLSECQQGVPEGVQEKSQQEQWAISVSA